MEFAATSIRGTASSARFGWLTTLVVLLCCPAFLKAATFGTSSYLQVNLSFMPFSYYSSSPNFNSPTCTLNNQNCYFPAASYTFSEVFNGTTYSSCPAGASVRGCFQTILGQLHAQGVSGVRVFVLLCDPSSQAFYESNGTSMCGMPWQDVSWNPSTNSVQQTWINNVGAFFQDVINAGITNLHITPAGLPNSSRKPQALHQAP